MVHSTVHHSLQLSDLEPNYLVHSSVGALVGPQSMFLTGGPTFKAPVASNSSGALASALHSQAMSRMQALNSRAQMINDKQEEEYDEESEVEQDEEYEQEDEEEFEEEFEEEYDEEPEAEHDEESEQEDEENKFYLFPKLPIELRLKIWKEAIKCERVVEVRFTKNHRRKKFEYVSTLSKQFPPLGGHL
jgi:hypothetical protein